nr:MAG TPA: hypothetical protein [Caudoviricetes sp.]
MYRIGFFQIVYIQNTFLNFQKISSSNLLFSNFKKLVG